ncbi:MAG: hypothetical protein KDA28_13060 [Phycisphaerales bacterium]|nr:hypothetical protein [Phycisphaerales bacterium]
MSKIGPDAAPDAESSPDVDAGPVVDVVPADVDVEIPLVDVDELTASLVDIGARVVGVLVNEPTPSGWQARSSPAATAPRT